MYILYFIHLSDLTGPGINFFNIFNFKNSMRESARTEPPFAMFSSALLRTNASENEAIQMWSKL